MAKHGYGKSKKGKKGNRQFPAKDPGCDGVQRMYPPGDTPSMGGGKPSFEKGFPSGYPKSGIP